MGINKVYYNDTPVIDLTDATVTTDKLVSGYTAYDKGGNLITGILKTAPLEPLYYDYNIGYISNGTWTYENPTNTFTDIYEVQANHSYLICLGTAVGTRFRSMFTTTDVTTKTSGTVSGKQIVNKNNPSSYDNAKFTTTTDGYILVAKDNIGHSGLFSYVFDQTEWT